MKRKMSLKKLRREIDEIDKKILSFLNRRADRTIRIGLLKTKEGGSVFDPTREREIYEKVSRLNRGPLSSETVQAIYREVISGARALEKSLTIAYQGPPLSYAHLASQKVFGSQVSYSDVMTIGDVFTEVERDRADYGAVPIENSIEGTVGYTLDRFTDTELTICSEVFLKIDHCLVGRAKTMNRVKRLYFHPQAFAQCRSWLEEHLYHLKPRDYVEVLSTSMAASMASHHAESAAIAHEDAARQYRLRILSRSIGESHRNVTRFLLIGKNGSGRTGRDKTSLMFSIKDRIGALHDILVPFKMNGINLTKIESRPSRKKPWEYYFFVDLKGHKDEKKVKQAITSLEKHCTFLKILGSYPASR